MFDIPHQVFRPLLLHTIKKIHNYRIISTPTRPSVIPFPTKPLTGIKMVLFDVYGTLLHARAGEISIHSDTHNQDSSLRSAAHQRLLLRMTGHTYSNESSVVAMIDKMTHLVHTHIARAHQLSRKRGIEFPEVDIRVIWRDILRHLSPPRKKYLGPLRVMQIALCYEMLVNSTSEMPGAQKTLAHISQHLLPMGIVSNAQFYTPLLLESLFGRSLPRIGLKSDLSFWSYCLGYAKPSVNMFKYVVKHAQYRYGISTHQILYVGNDMRNDIWCAQQSGIRSCLFAGDSRSLRLRKNDKLCHNLMPDTCISSLEELPGLLF